MMDTFSHNCYEQNQTRFNYHDDVEIDDHPEESGWETYLEDFSNQYKTHHGDSENQDKSSCSLLDVSPSLISDAATEAFPNRSFRVNFPEELDFWKARAKRICEDDSLEDTASSPVNSPKVSQLELIQTSRRKIEDYVSSIFVMRNMRSMRGKQIQIQEGNNNNNMDLRSRGLCVVPISMLANFNGRF